MPTVSVTNNDANLSAKTLQLLERDQTVTGLHTYSRGASAPFGVVAGAAKVDNLDADKLDGVEMAALAEIANTETISAVWTFSSEPSFPSSFWNKVWPVGAIFTAVVSTNPNTLLGFGTWTAFATGRVLVGIDAGQTEFDTVEETGGAKTHTLTSAEMPAHTHTQRVKAGGGAETDVDRATDRTGAEANGTSTTASTGGGGAHNNLQPYIVVYMWKRTA